MKKVLYLIYKLWIAVVFWTTLLLLYPVFWVLLCNEKWFPAAFRIKKLWSILIRTFIFCPMKIEFRGEFPKPPYIVVSNHCSYLDTVFMFGVVPDYFLFLGKSELLKWPLFRIFFRKMDIPVHREKIREALDAYHQANEALAKGECITIYPEATIPDDAPNIKRFKSGAFKMAMDQKVPVVPITWQNNFEILNDIDNLWSKNAPRKIKVVVHEVFEYQDFKNKKISELRDEVREVIDSALRE